MREKEELVKQRGARIAQELVDLIRSKVEPRSTEEIYQEIKGRYHELGVELYLAVEGICRSLQQSKVIEREVKETYHTETIREYFVVQPFMSTSRILDASRKQRKRGEELKRRKKKIKRDRIKKPKKSSSVGELNTKRKK